MSREVLRCLHCNLNQFRTESNHCRKCSGALPDAIPTLEGLNVGEALKIIRSMRNMSQANLAAKILVNRVWTSRVNRTWISKIENGHQQPSLDSLERIARALKVNTWDLFSIETAKEVWLRELGPYVISLNKQQRETVMLMARKLAA